MPVAVDALGSHPGGISDFKLLESFGDQAAHLRLLAGQFLKQPVQLIHARSGRHDPVYPGFHFVQGLAQGLEMPVRVIKNPEMGRGNPAEGAFLLFCLQAASALLPESEI